MVDTNTTVLIVAAILALGIVGNNLLARRATPAAPSGGGHDLRDLLSKFVHHGGDVVGETVAVHGDLLVLKQAGVFKAVPKDQATVVDDEVVLAGDVDWAAAEAAGTAWHSSNTSGAHDSISPALTRSEDVRKPALEAMKERLDEEE